MTWDDLCDSDDCDADEIDDFEINNTHTAFVNNDNDDTELTINKSPK